MEPTVQGVSKPLSIERHHLSRKGYNLSQMTIIKLYRQLMANFYNNIEKYRL